MRVLARLFRRLFLRELENAFGAGELRFFSKLANLAEPQAFARRLSELRRLDWVVYAKPPFAGPEQVLAYLARYTHRVAISSSRLIGADETGVTFKYKDYRIEGPGRHKTMTVAPGEFIRRFMLHVLPKGFHRIRHYGLLARSRTKADTLARARELIELATPVQQPRPPTNQDHAPVGTEAIDKPIHPCPCCGSPMVIIEMFEAGSTPRNRPTAPTTAVRIDTS